MITRFFLLAALALAVITAATAQEEERGGFGWQTGQWHKVDQNKATAPPQGIVEPAKKPRKYRRPAHPRCFDRSGKTYCRW